MNSKNQNQRIIVVVCVGIIFMSGCGNQTDETEKPPADLQSILITEIPSTADIIFTSIRYVLDDAACLDRNNVVKANFINDPECVKKIYDTEVGIVSPRQLYVLDIETGNIIQVTNTNYFYISGQVVDSHTLMVNAATSDTNDDGIINDRDQNQLYFLELTSGEMDCLTCGCGMEAVNNPDYSHVHEKIVFSAQRGENLNHLYTVDFQKNVVQLTDDQEYMDFDCSWSEDGTQIVFSRLPFPWFETPSQIWIMDSNGENLRKITDGGSNPSNEGPHGVYPIGIDADPDLSPDNRKIVFSRLKTGKENEPFGVYELIIIDIDTREEHVLDSSNANMVPEWKAEGIVFIRQCGALDPMERKQSLYIYKDGRFEELEGFPYNIFPIGAFGGSWIELINTRRLLRDYFKT